MKIQRKFLTMLLCVILVLADLTSAGSIVFAVSEETLSVQQPDEMTQEQSEKVESEEPEKLAEEGKAETEESESCEETETQTLEEQGDVEPEEPVGEMDAEEETPEVQEADTEETETQESAAEEMEDMIEDGADGVRIVAEQSVPFASDDIAGGTYQNITWVIDANGKLTVTGSGKFTGIWPWSNYKTSIKSAEIHWTGANTADRMFNGCSNLISLDLSGFDTQNVINMSHMFQDCSSLREIDLKGFNTQNVTNMYDMFYGCSSLVNLDLSNFNTQQVTDMSHMFNGCSSLGNINLSSFDTQNVTNMSYMFNDCSSLDNIDLSSFRTQNVTDMDGMFCNCSSLQSLDLSGFDTQSVVDMDSMFSGDRNLTSLNVSSFDTQNVMGMRGMFQSCSSLSNMDLSSFDTRNVVNMLYMFSNCSSLENLDLSNFNTQNIADAGMVGMFWDCNSLARLDVSSFDTQNVTNMSYMFAGCSSLTSLNVSSFDTQNVTKMEQMFRGCSSLISLNVSNFDTRNVTYMVDMFRGCSSLTSLNLSSFDTGNAAAGLFFDGCYGLNTLWTPKAGHCALPPVATDREVWQLSDGTVVQQEFGDLTRSIQVRKYRLPAQEPDEGSAEDQMQYVRNLTQASLQNADEESKAAIQNAIYNLLFKAEYRPMRSDIPGDRMTYTGTRDVIARWPIQNKDYGTSVFWGRSVTDARLGTVTYNTACAGCMSYACFATAYVYGTSGTCRMAVTPTGDSVRDFIRSYADPGEQLRYDMPHSIVFLGEKSDGDGFYYINYDGGDDAEGHVYHDLYVASYARYADFAAKLAGYRSRLYIYDTNHGSYYSRTAASAADVRSGQGAARIVTRLACPVEATVEWNGEVLDSRTPGTTSFGAVAREGEEIVFTLDYAPDYRLTVLGTGEGGMTLTLEYYDAAEELLDQRKFVDMPIRTETEITSGGFDSQATFVLYRSEDGNLTDAWGAGIGETVYGENTIFRGDNQAGADNTRFITFDANGGTIGADSSVVMATDDNAMLTALPIAVRDGYVFKGWYTSPAHGIKVDETRVYMENTTLYAQWEKTVDDNPGSEDESGKDTEEVPKEDIPEGGIPEGLWIAAIKDSIYTGRPLKPEVHVYDGSKRMKEGRDYTVGYQNNMKAADANAAKPPTVIIKGKGNYSGTEKATFNILPVSLADGSITVQDLVVSYNGRVQKKAVSVLFHGKKLSAGKDYTVSYPALTQGVAGAYQEEGTYEILLTAKTGGNFSGTRTVQMNITKAALLSQVTVKKIPDQDYNGNAVMPKPIVTLKKTVLTENEDYAIAYENNTEIGTATMILTGIGDYAGTKRVTFKIKGISLKNAVVSGIENKVYNGTGQTQNLTVRAGGVALREKTDYELLYENNQDAGKATVTIRGIKAYTGSVKKTFQIVAYDLNTDTDNQMNGLDGTVTAKYVKGGSKPVLQLTFAGKALVEGKDYTISYRNNKAVTTAATRKQPSILIKGKGNFKGTYTKNFTIEGKSLADTEYPVKMRVADKVFSTKPGKYISRPELIDADGGKLAAGKDYDKNIVYTLADGTVLTNQSKVPVGTCITATVTGKGAYSGELTADYHITVKDFSKAKISISPQTYTGKKIILHKDNVTVKSGKDTLLFGTDYEIVEDSYSNHTEKGTAKVTIIGKGNYGGTKSASFKIVPKKMAWFYKLLSL